MKWRILLAVAVTIAVYVVLDQVGSRFTPVPDPTADPSGYFRILAVISAATVFCAVSAGSWVAGGRFLLPALVLWTIPTATSIWLGYRLQLPAAPTSIGEFVLRNAPVLVATLAATLLGVASGRWLARLGAGLGSAGAEI